MISVEEAQARILKGIRPLAPQQISIAAGLGRTLSSDLVARRTQPPKSVSAMDGYAVRADDVTQVPADLKVVGEIAAGSSFEAPLSAGECCRIFTGAPLPPGADAIVIQEDTERESEESGAVRILETVGKGNYVRRAGLDFLEGDTLLHSGRTLTSRDIAIAAAMNIPWIEVYRRPRIAILTTGNEIVMPGDPIRDNQIIGSNALALAAAIEAIGAEAYHLGIAEDTVDGVKRQAACAEEFDLLLTTGGASVGKHDLVGKALSEMGLAQDFWKIAMRPGKPLLFGRIGKTPVLGLPGNPVSSIVCFTMFAAPAISKMAGQANYMPDKRPAKLGIPVGENDRRQDYLRGSLEADTEGGLPIATPFDVQDSSMLYRLSQASCLIVRPPHAPAAACGALVEVILFPGEPRRV